VGILILLHKKHKLWVNYLRKYGCPNHLCEDIVQEMYIKIDKHLKKTNSDIMYGDDINISYVCLTLRNLYLDYVRKNSKIEKIEINDDLLTDLEDTIYVNDTLDSEVRQKVINEWYNDELYLDLLEQDNINEVNYTKEELEKYYLRRIFKEIFYDEVQISKLSKDTKITYWSLRNTINHIKEQIKLKYENRKRSRNDI